MYSTRFFLSAEKIRLISDLLYDVSLETYIEKLYFIYS